MSIPLEALKNRLARENDEFRRLLEKHRSFEEELQKLSARHVLTEEEKLEAVRLKKKKLALKDRMAEIARQFEEIPASLPGR